MKNVFGVTSRKDFMRFSENAVHHLLKSNNVGRHFAWIFCDFAQIFRDFSRIFDKSKLLWATLHTYNPASYTQCILSY